MYQVRMTSRLGPHPVSNSTEARREAEEDKVKEEVGILSLGRTRLETMQKVSL